MVGVTWKGSRARPSLPDLRAASQPPQNRQQPQSRPPPVSFKDKEAYQELFKPLPKPEPIPAFAPVKLEGKSWRELQEERERLVRTEVERTRLEANSMWDRVKSEDMKRQAQLEKERNRIEAEFSARERLMMKEREERERKDRERKESIKRQEELLSGRMARAKTTEGDMSHMSYGPGIHVFHYKDPVVADIVKQTRQQEILSRRSNKILDLPTSPTPARNGDDEARSDGGFYSEVQEVKHNVHPSFTAQARPASGQIRPAVGQPNQVMNGRPGAAQFHPQLAQSNTAPTLNGSNHFSRVSDSRMSTSSSTNFNEYKSVMEGKDLWRVDMMARSQSSSSSSTTSR